MTRCIFPLQGWTPGRNESSAGAGLARSESGHILNKLLMCIAIQSTSEIGVIARRVPVSERSLLRDWPCKTAAFHWQSPPCMVRATEQQRPELVSEEKSPVAGLCWNNLYC